MFKKNVLNFSKGFFFLFALSIFFYACSEKENITLEDDQKIESADFFKKQLTDHTQTITANDLGNGIYSIKGEQGTRVEIDNALVNAAGERVRGAIEIKLIEIYTVQDMILLRKQTMADYDGTLGILESGGEVFVKAYQNGEELFADGNGEMQLLLPTENTGGARNDMELFYGEETGDQVIWKPTGEKVRVVNNAGRNGSDYLVMIQNILGWINVDVLYGEQGDPIECIKVVIDCEELCRPIDANSTVVAMHVQSQNSAFELQYVGGSSFELCGIEGEGTFPLGGITVTFIVAIDCGDGSVQSAIVTTVLTAGVHTQIITCDNLRLMGQDEFEYELYSL